MFARAEWVGDCLLWRGYAVKGYGRTTFRRRQMLVHRIIFAWATGAWPVARVLHTCDTPRCIKPEHLFAGSQADNMTDMAVKGRSSRSPYRHHKLTQADATEIRRLLSLGHRQAVVAKRFDVSPQTISAINCGHHWKGELT